ncbi:MAG: hypothetical protein PHU23_17900 [Dehalococcoidales bacterium]|nr:hypothetical protein [Dehalococcoidales bacterium]
MNLDKELSELQIKRRNDFLKELSELTTKYDIEIDACGCCDSPFLRDRQKLYSNSTNGVIIGDNLDFRDGKYNID